MKSMKFAQEFALIGCFIAAMSIMAPGVRAAPEKAQAQSMELQEVVVTATRREESLSKVPISVSAFTQESIDQRGIKDFQDVARFTPGVNIDNSGTNNISIRGISSTGGAGTTGIYIDDTPIQIRALAFNPDDTLPKTFDIDRVEVLRGPQGTLFGAGSEGGTVRYITTQPSLTKTSIYSREELSYTQGGEPNYEAGVGAGTPLIDGVLGVRATAWYRRDGGWIDRIDPTTLQSVDKNVNHDETTLLRLGAVWAASDSWSLTPSIYYQNRHRNDVSIYWPIYSDPGSDKYVSANPTQRAQPDKFYLPALKIQGDLGKVRLISNTSYYNRHDTTGYDGTLYNLGFYQAQPQIRNPATTPVLAIPLSPSGGFLPPFPLLDGTGIHLPAGLQNYRSPASIQNNQDNFTQEIRLQSNDPESKFVWTTGVFFSSDRQSYLEQIYDPELENFTQTLVGKSVTDVFGFPLLANGDSYLLSTRAKDQQLAWYGEGNYSFTDQFKLTVGLRYSKTKYSFQTYTAGPQLFGPPQSGTGDKKENSATPKVSLSYQYDSQNLYYFTYAKGFRPGGGNNPVPQAACAADFQNFGINGSPQTFNSDTTQSFEVGAKNNIDNRIRLASSIYYIKWNNIQQTVVPPICQISFITNLGGAVAKGVDLQADVSLTAGLTFELATGYTDARYTKDSRLSPAEARPVVSNGDAIEGQSGQPSPPFTATVGLEYRFTAFEREMFLRGDYEYQGRAKWPGATQDSTTLQFGSANFILPSTSFASLRAGVKLGSWEAAAFVDNLTDSHTLTNFNFTIDPGNGASRLERDQTFRPRTMGVTVTYRN